MVLGDFRGDHAGQIRIVGNTERCPEHGTEGELSGAVGITSIPTIMAFRDGILIFAQPGALPAEALEQVIEGVKGMDMEEVRRQIAEQEQEGDKVPEELRS